jgi:putative transposase
VCEKEVEQHTFDPDKVAGIDLGMNNLASVTSNDGCLQPLLINGRALKSINQYYNKKKAHLQSSLPKGVYNSKKMSQLTHKRNMKIHDFMHKSSRALVDYLVKNEIGKLVIGKNKNWKQNLNIGKKNNQSFTSIPFQKLIDQIIYKASLKGIEVVLTEESYTSKCSFIDMEPLKKQESYKGRRIKRGLFKSSNGTLINADCNGSGNIIRKVFPNAFCLAANQANGIEGVVVRPLKVQYNEFHKLKDSAFSAESF